MMSDVLIAFIQLGNCLSVPRDGLNTASSFSAVRRLFLSSAVRKSYHQQRVCVECGGNSFALTKKESVLYVQSTWPCCFSSRPAVEHTKPTHPPACNRATSHHHNYGKELWPFISRGLENRCRNDQEKNERACLPAYPAASGLFRSFSFLSEVGCWAGRQAGRQAGLLVPLFLCRLFRMRNVPSLMVTATLLSPTASKKDEGTAEEKYNEGKKRLHLQYVVYVHLQHGHVYSYVLYLSRAKICHKHKHFIFSLVLTTQYQPTIIRIMKYFTCLGLDKLLFWLKIHGKILMEKTKQF